MRITQQRCHDRILTCALARPRRAGAVDPQEEDTQHKDAQCYVRELFHASETATGEGEERRVDVVVCSEREEAGLAAAPVAQ